MVSIIACIVLWSLFVVAGLYSGILVFLPAKFKLAILLIPVPELICSGILLYYLSSWKKNKLLFLAKFFYWTLLFWCLIAQIIYFGYTGDFIPAVAIENLNQLYLIINKWHLVMILLAFMLWGSYLYLSYKYEQQHRKNIKRDVILVLFFITNCFLIIWQNGGYSNESHANKYIVGQSPIIGLINQTRQVYSAGNHVMEHKVIGYPFLKTQIYGKALPFSKSSNNISHPNVILILTEGTSARTLGCYGGKFEGLTPNIDQFAKDNMLVNNYFNHTAATFRGTLGQLASCFPEHGGYERGTGWADSGREKLLKQEYQTITKILSGQGYDTYFISPHKNIDPYTDLARLIGFTDIVTADTMKNYLGRNPYMFSNGAVDADTYGSAIGILRKRLTDKPLFLCFYTFGTHAMLDSPPTGIKYQKLGNTSLNTIHTMDAAFGKFWDYFRSSPYYKNTIVIFTADHAHYYDKPFFALYGSEPSYKRYFIDKIPLIICDPTHRLPKKFDAKGNTSLSLTPTILHLLGINNVRNSFLGQSLFDDNYTIPRFTFAAMGGDYYGIYDNTAFNKKSVNEQHRIEMAEWIKKVQLFYECEDQNRVFK